METPEERAGFVTEETVAQLSDGFLNILQPEVVRVQESLQELISNQEKMLTSIEEKHSQFESTTDAEDISGLLLKAPLYKQKLTVITKQMSALDKRVKKLETRSGKLKEARLAREAQMKKDLEQRLQQEKLLEAKPSK